MKYDRSISWLAMLAALFAAPWPASAQAPAAGLVRAHRQFIAMPGSAAARDQSSAPYFVALQGSFTAAYPTIGANSDGTDLWPCIGGGTTANPDCPVVGNPAVPLPGYAIVMGFPGYAWKLDNGGGMGDNVGCDAMINGTGTGGVPYMPCGQIATYYEDGTRDDEDDLLQHVVVRQGGTIIYDSGTIDYGPAGPAVSYPADVVLTLDANFGYWPGAAIGPNNGNCSADLHYPLSAAAYPHQVYTVASGQTCGRPHKGVADVTTVTILATPAYTQLSGQACTDKGAASPCYVVHWTRTHGIEQDFKMRFD